MRKLPPRHAVAKQSSSAIGLLHKRLQCRLLPTASRRMASAENSVSAQKMIRRGISDSAESDCAKVHRAVKLQLIQVVIHNFPPLPKIALSCSAGKSDSICSKLNPLRPHAAAATGTMAAQIIQLQQAHGMGKLFHILLDHRPDPSRHTQSARRISHRHHALNLPRVCHRGHRAEWPFSVLTSVRPISRNWIVVGHESNPKTEAESVGQARQNQTGAESPIVVPSIPACCLISRQRLRASIVRNLPLNYFRAESVLRHRSRTTGDPPRRLRKTRRKRQCACRSELSTCKDHNFSVHQLSLPPKVAVIRHQRFHVVCKTDHFFPAVADAFRYSRSLACSTKSITRVRVPRHKPCAPADA